MHALLSCLFSMAHTAAVFELWRGARPLLIAVVPLRILFSSARATSFISLFACHFCIDSLRLSRPRGLILLYKDQSDIAR